MIEIMKDTVGMRFFHIKPRVIGCRTVIFGIPIQTGKRMRTTGMVVNNIKKNSHTRFVAFIDKSLIHMIGTVSLVQSKIETRIVSPAVIAIELLHRHQLNSIET